MSSPSEAALVRDAGCVRDPEGLDTEVVLVRALARSGASCRKENVQVKWVALVAIVAIICLTIVLLADFIVCKGQC
jgi:hypothetical protein